METICLAILAGYAPMGTAIVVLYRQMMKCQEKRLEGAEEHMRTLSELKDYLKRRGANRRQS